MKEFFESFWNTLHKNILNSTGITFAIFAASSSYFYLIYNNIIKNAESIEFRAFALISILFGMLFFVNIIRIIANYFNNKNFISDYYFYKKKKQKMEKIFESLDDQSKIILAYLVHNNLRFIETSIDGDHAKILISLKFFDILESPTKQYDINSIPYFVPDDVWDIITSRKNSLPIASVLEMTSKPWRVSWRVR